MNTMAYEYQYHLNGEPKGIPEIELELAVKYPEGVLETYHVAAQYCHQAIEAIAVAIPDEAERSTAIRRMHDMLASVAVYGYSAGVCDERDSID